MGLYRALPQIAIVIGMAPPAIRGHAGMRLALMTWPEQRDSFWAHGSNSAATARLPARGMGIRIR